MASRLVVGALLGFAITQSHGASFDCAKARTKVEGLICTDATLSGLDDEMAAAYKTALRDEKLVHKVRQAQKQWLKERDSCADTDCLEMAYRSRIDELNPSKGRFITILAKEKALCEAYQRYVEHEVATKNQYVQHASPVCQRNFGEGFAEFAPVKWREIKPEDYPELAVQAYRYMNFWPWDRPGAKLHLADSEFKGQLGAIELNHSNNWWHMWIGDADIGNTGHTETLLRVEEGRCGEESMTARPPRWSIPVMVVDATGKGIDTAKSEWILGVSVRHSTSPLTPNIREIPGLHSILKSAFDTFAYSQTTFFDQWEDEWELPHSVLADQRYAKLTVYTISLGKTEAICRFKFNRQAK
jgi:uncharacterized protein